MAENQNLLRMVGLDTCQRSENAGNRNTYQHVKTGSFLMFLIFFAPAYVSDLNRFMVICVLFVISII